MSYNAQSLTEYVRIYKHHIISLTKQLHFSSNLPSKTWTGAKFCMPLPHADGIA